MKQVPFKGEVLEYQGKKLDSPIQYDGNADSYENLSEAKGSEDWLSDNEILKVINSKKLTAAKAAKYQEVTKELKKAYEDSSDYKRKQVIDAVLLAGKSQAEAEAFAASLGL
jgi:hypothetical protein